jgi:hypothetical protein
MKASVRQLQANIEALETKLEVEVAETDDPQERANWNRIRVIIPDKAVVEVLLEYLLQEVRLFISLADISATGYGSVETLSLYGRPPLRAKAYPPRSLAYSACRSPSHASF